MVNTCCVCRRDQCLSTSRSFHSFPSSDEKKRSWILAIDKKEVPKSATICSDHFKDEDFTIPILGTRRRLKPGAIPSQNLNVIQNVASVISDASSCLSVNNALPLVNLNLNDSKEIASDSIEICAAKKIKFQLFEDDFFSILRTNGDQPNSMLNDLHIEKFSKLIPSMHMQPPTLLQILSSIQERAVDKEFVQILFSGPLTAGHWVCVWYDSAILHMYDSLGGDLHDDHLKYLSRIFPKKQYLEVLIEKVQIQTEPYNCGLLAIAFALTIVYGICPCNVRFDENQMRNHLINVFEKQEISMFPLHSSSRVKIDKFQNYIIDEKRCPLKFEHAVLPKCKIFDLQPFIAQYQQIENDRSEVLDKIDITFDKSIIEKRFLHEIDLQTGELEIKSTAEAVKKEIKIVEKLQNKICIEKSVSRHLKRKSDLKYEDSIPNKKYKVSIGQKTEWISKDDFSCERKWLAICHLIDSQRNKIKTLQRTKNRQKQKTNSFKTMLNTLTKKYSLTENGEEFLNSSIPIGVQKIIQGILTGKKYKQFPPELKSFALTLHFYSPRSYEFLRRSLIKILPHPSTLREWLKTYNYEPGMSKEALETVKRLCVKSAEQNKQLFFNLTLDEMAIRKKLVWNGKKFEGYVDLGQNEDGICSDNAPLATNALVYMLVCINGHFKIPIAFYLIDSLNGNEKSVFTTNILEECFNNDIKICNITFDGASSNISMAEKLGACIYNSTSAVHFSFKNSKNIFVTLDACHMLKLTRNTLHSCDITDDEAIEHITEGTNALVLRKTISWKYIEALVNLQELEQLHAATKVRRRHISFQNEKMKVFLAAQTLSSSTSKALEFCEFDLELDEFEGASATARFCQIVNDCFDILNSKNKFHKDDGKRGISAENLPAIKIIVDTYSSYLQNLKINSVPILNSSKRTGFLGLITGMKNAIELAEYLFNTGKLDFLLTFKLSQDHLETFFSCVRRFGGFNNNPTAVQFKSAYKKLLSHVSISVPLTANCIPDEDTLLLRIGNRSETNESVLDISEEDLLVTSHAIDFVQLNNYLVDVIGYISGAVVRIVMKKIKCATCKSYILMEQGKEPLSCLQRRKTRGKLISASQDTISVCKIAERIFRMQSNFKENFLVEKMIVKSMHILEGNIFSMGHHEFEQSPLCDHRCQLIKLILNHYFQIRLHHYAASQSENETRIRMRNNKLTLFYNQ